MSGASAQAELDHHVRDTYNYVTVQADIVMPGRQLAVLEDAYRQAGPSVSRHIGVVDCETKYVHFGGSQ